MNKMSKLAVALASAVALGGFGVNSYAATASGTATAEVLTPIGVSTTKSLFFGAFAHGAGGPVTVNTDGTRTATGPILSTIGGTPVAAIFHVTGDATTNATYSIVTTGTDSAIASTSVPADTMAFAHCTALAAAATCVPANNVTSGMLTEGAQDIYMGGTLTVGLAQAAHQDYTGAISVTVEYN